MTPKADALLNRRTLLLTVATAPSLWFSSADAATLPPSAVSYQSTPKGGKQCDGCNLFVAPSGCKSVSGAIAPTGWCKLWVKKA